MSTSHETPNSVATSMGEKLPPSNGPAESADNDVLISAQGEYEVAADDDLKIHDATKTFCVLDHQLEEMIESLRDNGQMESVVVYEGKILDGQKRNLGRRKLGLPLKCRTITDLGGLTPLEWVVRKNMAAGTARQLNDSQRALIGAKLCRKVYEAEARERMRGGKRLPDDVRMRACEKAARAVNVRVNRLRQALKVEDAGCNELERAVSEGTVVISIAAKIAQLKNDRQMKRAIVAANEKDKNILSSILGASSQLKDGLGEELTSEMQPLFGRVETWECQIKRLKDVADWLRESAAKPEGRVLKAALDPAALKAMIEGIKAAKPWCQCPYCDHFPDQACPFCDSSGFLTKAEQAAGVARSAESLKKLSSQSD